MTRLILLSAILSIASVTLAYPLCATSCIYDTTLITAAGCSLTDAVCKCSSNTYIEALTCCIRSKCDYADQITAGAEAVYACSTYGVTINTDMQISCSAATSSIAFESAAYTSVANAAYTSPASYYTPSPNYKSYKKKKGLTAGAKGGIGAGVAFIVLLLSGLLAFLRKRKNANKAAATAAVGAPATATPGAPAEQLEKANATVEINPVSTPVPQYSAQGGPYAPPLQPEGQYPQPVYAPQPQYPQQQQFAQYGQPPPQQFQSPQQQYQQPRQQYQQPQQQFQQPPQQFQQPTYTPGPELQGSPIEQQPQQGFSGAELPGGGAIPPKHEVP